MLIEALDRSPDTWLYNESNRQAFYSNYRLKSRRYRHQLIRRARCAWVVFKPLCDAHYADHLLDLHPASKAIWLYRDYRDVANSAQQKWVTSQEWMIRHLVTKNHFPHWFCERVPDQVRETVAEFYHPDISEGESAVLKWYVRNRLYFDLGLDARTGQVMLVRYEDLVTNPVESFGQLFSFLEIPFKPAFTAGVFPSSVGKSTPPVLDPGVAALCDELLARLDAARSCAEPLAGPTVSRL